MFYPFIYIFLFLVSSLSWCFLAEKVHISEVPDDEVLKICLEFYHHFSQDLYQASHADNLRRLYEASEGVEFVFVNILVNCCCTRKIVVFPCS